MNPVIRVSFFIFCKLQSPMILDHAPATLMQITKVVEIFHLICDDVFCHEFFSN